jgi:hypothetical protein
MYRIILTSTVVWSLLFGVAFMSKGGPPLNDQSNYVVAAFKDGPTEVLVDVMDVDLGTTIATGQATTQLSISASDTIYHSFDLATVPNYPTSCTPGTYLVTFEPDGADCSEAGTPGACASSVVQVGGSACAQVAGGSGSGLGEESPGVVIATGPISAQGITRAVIDFNNRRGRDVIKWRKVPVSGSEDFDSPDSTVWLVHFYTETGSYPALRCVVPSTTDPATSLPTADHCP